MGTKARRLPIYAFQLNATQKQLLNADYTTLTYPPCIDSPNGLSSTERDSTLSAVLEPAHGWLIPAKTTTPPGAFPTRGGAPEPRKIGAPSTVSTSAGQEWIQRPIRISGGQDPR
ncbi:hypothetical protein BDK51DRAFT_46600 [Blyttiomyces helicus]|uniref:Uncharacterized protein n=1 Tax=Blyttiomyces helicus TaxID=388810 RepID=A0A4P9VUW1_9FUNG|nr:hypothetical protein BDK51DRAFT_46600 [Blyttiomyces helicus]|eukprot:RKO83384.1 hypothetical protein BDK51DRAFT_46600 [Blyttiomyces helicus]